MVDGKSTGGVEATPAGDVYMLGGLMFEVLTTGLVPFYWMNDARLLVQRRRHAAGILFRPEGTPSVFMGLKDLSILEAAKVDGVELSAVFSSELEPLVDVMSTCLRANARERPSLREVKHRLEQLLHATSDSDSPAY